MAKKKSENMLEVTKGYEDFIANNKVKKVTKKQFENNLKKVITPNKPHVPKQD